MDNAAETISGLTFFLCACSAGGISEKILKKSYYFFKFISFLPL